MKKIQSHKSSLSGFSRLLLVFIMLFGPSIASAAKHALIISNGNYEYLNDLQNTHTDGDAYSFAFENVGFQIARGADLSRRDTNILVYRFLDKIQPGDEVVFVYAGHGWSNGSSNFVIPTDTPVVSGNTSSGYYESETIDIQKSIIDGMRNRGAKLVVAIIDACRTNPFLLSNGRGAVGLNRGLVSVEAGEGTFVVYSAASGQEALDSLPNDPPDQKLSLFTRHFVDKLKPGIFLHDAVLETRKATAQDARVYANHKQRPAYYDETSERICFLGNCQSTNPLPRDRLSEDSTKQRRQCERLSRIAQELGTCQAYKPFWEFCKSHGKYYNALEFAERHCEQFDPTKAEKWALVVGINDYANLAPFSAPVAELSDLKGAVNDAKIVANSLRNIGFNLPDDFLLLDRRATKENFLNRLKEITSKATPNDLVVLHLSGHGGQFVESQSSKRGLLLNKLKPQNKDSTSVSAKESGGSIDKENLRNPVDHIQNNGIWNIPIGSIESDVSSELIASGIDETKDGLDEGFLFVDFDPQKSRTGILLDDELFDLLPDATGPTVLISFDIVHSRGMLDIGVLHPKLGFGLATASENRLISETKIDDRPYGAFSYYLAQGLSGEADFDLDNWVTWSELKDFVEDSVYTHMNQNQRPVLLFGGDSGRPLIYTGSEGTR